jgi:hypothetical protein
MQTTNGVKAITTLDLIGSTGLRPTILLEDLQRWRILGCSDFVTDIWGNTVTCLKLLP